MIARNVHSIAPDPRKMDDGAWISPFAPWRSVKSKSLNSSWNNFLADVDDRLHSHHAMHD